MFTGFDTTSLGARTSRPAPRFDDAPEPDALLEDLAADPSDLLDLARLRGVAFRSLVGELLATRGRSDAKRITRLGAGSPAPEPPPFVWVRLLPPRGSRPTVRAGWLTPEAFDLIVVEARLAGRGSTIEVIVPLDSGTAAIERVRALCGTVVGDDVAVVVQAQEESRVGRRWRGTGAHARGDARAPHVPSRDGAWTAFDLVAVRS